MTTGDYTQSIYQGGYDSLDPAKSNEFYTGAVVRASDIGISINPQTANQLSEVNKVLNQGFVPVEMGAMSGDIFEAIPDQHFDEVRRVAKLTGAKISLHAPIQNMDVSGMTEQGWSEQSRKNVENQLIDVINKSQRLDDRGGTPVTVHSSMIPGTITNQKGEIQKITAINQDTYKMVPIEEDVRYIPSLGLETKDIMTPEVGLETINNTEWHNSLSAIGMQKKAADEVLGNAAAALEPIFREGYDKEIGLSKDQQAAMHKAQKAKLILSDAATGFNSAFNKAAKYSKDEDSRDVLGKISEKWKVHSEKMGNLYKSFKEKKIDANEYEVGRVGLSIAETELIDNSLIQIGGIHTPEVYVQSKDFAQKKSAETFANVALASYQMANKAGKDASKICIENMFPDMAFSTAKEMNELVEASRDKFVDNAKARGIMSESQAKKQAEEIIGVTFDVGHLNLARKHGFQDEDLAREAEMIAKNVKHVHLTDNFGFSDSHLAPGMGNVPHKLLLEKLEKAGFEGRKIVEAGGLINHFKESPFMYSLAALGAPMSSSGGVGGSWNTSYGLQEGYFGGFGGMLPQTSYTMFGAGFSQLPAELGGNVQGRSSFNQNRME